MKVYTSFAIDKLTYKLHRLHPSSEFICSKLIGFLLSKFANLCICTYMHVKIYYTLVVKLDQTPSPNPVCHIPAMHGTQISDYLEF